MVLPNTGNNFGELHNAIKIESITALALLKKTFPDYPDWPQGAVEETIKMMQQYATECVAQDREEVKRKCVYYEKEHILFDLQTFDCLPFTFETKLETI